MASTATLHRFTGTLNYCTIAPPLAETGFPAAQVSDTAVRRLRTRSLDMTGLKRRLRIADVTPDRRTILKLSAMGMGGTLVGGSAHRAAAQDVTTDAASGMQFAYVASDSRSQAVDGILAAGPIGISVYAIGPATGAFTSIQTLPSDNAFFFAFDPDQSHLYVVNAIDDYEGGANGSLEAYARDPKTGLLTLLNRVDSGGAVSAQPAVDPSGRWVVVANYSGANVTVFPIEDDGSLGEMSSEVKREGTGPNTERQDQSRPHAAVFDPGGAYVAVADLGTDSVVTYAFDPATGTLTEASSVHARPGAGPRHIAFNADGTIMYVVNELDATINVYVYDSVSGAIDELLQTVSTVPDPFDGLKSTAEIAVHPSGKFLYNTNRGFADTVTPEGDAIVGWAIDPDDGTLTLIGHTTDEIGQSWSFAFDTGGANLFAANYTDNTITQFAVDPETGALTFTGNRTEVPFPFAIAISE
ncbi:MAG: lactonase family protein [Thermomicrobiales bacterium]|nr:MAG: lactonase family protein [Thermomicrobiales bacterium]